jgi:hypothetical protein
MTSQAVVSTSTSPSSSFPRWLSLFMLAWLAFALLVGATGRLAAIPFPGPQMVLVGLTVLSIFLGTRLSSVRAWIDAVPLRVLVGAHVVRLVGSVFLVLAARGLLSPVFAERAGWGDIVSAIGALVLVLSGDPRTPRHRALYLIWNTFGLLDFVNVVITAAWIGVSGVQPGLVPLVHLPLSLLPTFFVPILFASHVFVFRRLAAMGRESHAS